MIKPEELIFNLKSIAFSIIELTNRISNEKAIDDAEMERMRSQFRIIQVTSEDLERRKKADLQLNSDNNGGIVRIKFSKKEIELMPKRYQKVFAVGDMVVYCRRRSTGVYEARVRRKDLHIEVSSNDFNTLKRKFIEKLNLIETQKQQEVESQERTPKNVLFMEYCQQWLTIKKSTIKPGTYRDYDRTVNIDILPYFKQRYIADITREELQAFILDLWNNGLCRKAEKVHLVFRCVFDLICEDFDIRSPMNKVVIPFREAKSGSQLSYEEERKLVDFCTSHINEKPMYSAYLVLLYFGLRRSELASLVVNDNETITVKSAKTRLGRKDEFRTIPFTPVFKRVLPYVDFEKAKGCNVNSLTKPFKAILPNHHPHELRYTFITRCKECGVNQEVVMIWDGHKYDKDVVTSRVDRGYTDYRANYLIEEAKKVDYNY